MRPEDRPLFEALRAKLQWSDAQVASLLQGCVTGRPLEEVALSLGLMAPDASAPSGQPSSLGRVVPTRPGDVLAEAKRTHDAEREALLHEREAAIPPLWQGNSRYVLKEEIARGGMGRIVLAEDRNLGRTVAMKLLIGGSTESVGLQVRFTEEAQITGQLQHPNIIPVHDFGLGEDGQLFFTMKRVQGQTLRDVLRELRHCVPEAEAKWQRGRLLDVFLKICLALAYAHSRGVIHRDLKPSNVMLGDFGEVLVMDWGLAKIIHTSDEGVRSHREGQVRFATRRGEIIGTPGYMPPELALGQQDEVDARADLYSLGAILYELLTLRPPYGGRDGRQILKRMLREPLTPPSERAPERAIPQALDQLCLRCLARDPDQRPESALAVHDTLSAFLDEARTDHRQTSAARAHLEQAKRYAEVFREKQRTLEALQARQDTTRRRSPWLGPDSSLEVARPSQVDEERLSALTASILSFQQALAISPGELVATESLRSLYWSALHWAERRGDLLECHRFETLLKGLGPGRLAERLQGSGRLSLTTDPPGARAVLFVHEQAESLLVPTQPRDLGHTPLTQEEIPMGSYLLVLRAPGLRDTWVPFQVQRRAELQLDVRLRTDADLLPGFVYLPGGRYPQGGDERASWPLPEQTVTLSDFCLSRLPVSVRQYLEFINALALASEEEAWRRSPRINLGSGATSLFELAEDGRFRQREGVALSWPVSGVSALDAEDYARWRSALDGVKYRLPSEQEWEAAARGADRRAFPWGDHFEPTFCNCAHARPTAPQLEPCGSYIHDRSPFGVMDLAGGVADWTATSTDDGLARICRGGRYDQLEQAARAASRQALPPDATSLSVGFRLAHDPGTPDDTLTA